MKYINMLLAFFSRRKKDPVADTSIAKTSSNMEWRDIVDTNKLEIR